MDLSAPAGLDNLSSRGIARIDGYSYLTGGQTWINHEWLAQIFFGLAWKLGNVTGLVMLKLFLGLLTIGILWGNFSLQRVDPLAGVMVIFIGIVLLASRFFDDLSPNIFPASACRLVLYPIAS